MSDSVKPQITLEDIAALCGGEEKPKYEGVMTLINFAKNLARIEATSKRDSQKPRINATEQIQIAVKEFLEVNPDLPKDGTLPEDVAKALDKIYMEKYESILTPPAISGRLADAAVNNTSNVAQEINQTSGKTPALVTSVSTSAKEKIQKALSEGAFGMSANATKLAAAIAVVAATSAAIGGVMSWRKRVKERRAEQEQIQTQAPKMTR